MGDFADDALNREIDEWVSDAEGDYGWGEAYHKKHPRCNHCGSIKVIWKLNKQGRWRLYNINGRTPHRCCILTFQGRVIK